MSKDLQPLLMAGSELLADAARAAADGALEVSEIIELAEDVLQLGMALMSSGLFDPKVRIINRGAKRKKKWEQKLRRLRETRHAFKEE